MCTKALASVGRISSLNLKMSSRFRNRRATSPDGSVLQFSGHSLGGSLAEIASTYFSDVYPNAMVTETSIGALHLVTRTLVTIQEVVPIFNIERVLWHQGSYSEYSLVWTLWKTECDKFHEQNKKGPGTKLWDTFVKTLL